MLEKLISKVFEVVSIFAIIVIGINWVFLKKNIFGVNVYYYIYYDIRIGFESLFVLVYLLILRLVLVLCKWD